MDKKHITLLILLLLIVFSFRLFLVFQQYVIVNDGTRYVRLAKQINAGEFQAVLDHYYPPGYPLAIAITQKAAGDYELAGYLVAVLFGTLATIPIFLILSRVGNAKIATLGCLLYAMSPYILKWHTKILSEPMLTFFLMWTFFFIIEGFRKEKTRFFLIATAVAGAGYFVKPEAVIPVGLLVIALLYRVIFKKGIHKKKELVSLIVICVILLAIILPYLVYIKDKPALGSPDSAGEWKISLKFQFSDITPERMWTLAKQEFWALVQMFDYMRPIVFIFAIFYFFARKTIPRNDTISGIFNFLVIAYFLIIAGYRFSKRHFTQIIPLMDVWGVYGFLYLESKLSRLFKRRINTAKVGIAAFVVIVVLVSIRNFRPEEMERRNVLQAATYITNTGPAQPVIVGDAQRLAYYTHGEDVRIEFTSLNYVKNVVEKHHADYVVLEEEHNFVKEIRSLQPAFLRFERAFPAGGDGDDFLLYTVIQSEMRKNE